jgi:hypothetical protein
MDGAGDCGVIGWFTQGRVVAQAVSNRPAMIGSARRASDTPMD